MVSVDRASQAATAASATYLRKETERKQDMTPGATLRDSVSLSPLAQSLSGEAGDLFSALDEKLREKLVGLVQSGAISADEVADGLSGFVKVSRASKRDETSMRGISGAGWRELGERKLANVSEALAIALARKQPGADQAALQEQADALTREGDKLRQESDAWKQREFQRAQEVVASGNAIRLGEGVAMARLRELGVGDELAEAAK